MDFNGNVCTGQCGQTEVPWTSGVANGLRKNCCLPNEDKNGSMVSCDSLESSNARDFPRNRPRDTKYQKAGRQSENYAEMCEHERGGGNACEGNEQNFNDGNVWPSGSCDPCCDNFGNGFDSALFEANPNHNVCANCKAGVNPSPQRAACEKKCDETAKHNVSFKRCCERGARKPENVGYSMLGIHEYVREHIYENPVVFENPNRPHMFGVETKCNVSINQMWSKKRRKRTNPDCALKNKTERKVTEPNHRCTFETCYGNCDTYVVELSESDCNQCQNCQNMDFDSSNAYLEDCCYSHEPKPCSSSISVHSVRRVHQVCANCTEFVKCCSSREPKCDRCSSSKHCLQRVHFTKPRHSCCSFCSRKCSPSRASLFVEIGSSVADLRCLRSGQVLRLCNASSESLGNGLVRRESDPVKRNKSDVLKTRSKSKKRADPCERKCNPNCRTQPGYMGRSFSDKIECPEIACDAIEKGIARKRKSNCSLHQPFSHKASTVCFDTKKTDCWQQCEAYERSMWEEFRKGKLWLQDSCKHFLRTAATSINHLVKQTSKGKLFKKCTRKPDKCQGCDRTGVCANEGNLSNCLRESVCWTEMVTDDSNNCNPHCCQNACCYFNEDSNTTGVFQCQKYDHYNYCQTARDDRERCFGIRERGGSDSPGGPPKRKNSKDTNSNSSSSSRGANSRYQATQRQPSMEAARGRARQGQPVTTTIDSTIQTSVTHSTLDPTSATQRSVAFQRRIIQVRQGEPTAQDERLTSRTPTRALPPARTASKTKEAPAAGDPTATTPRSAAGTADSEIQCEIIKLNRVVCSPSGTETSAQVESSCSCGPGAVKHATKDDEFSTVAVRGSDTDLVDTTLQAESSGVDSEIDAPEAPKDVTTDDTQDEIVDETVPDDPVIDTAGESESETITADEEVPGETSEVPDDSPMPMPDAAEDPGGNDDGDGQFHTMMSMDTDATKVPDEDNAIDITEIPDEDNAIDITEVRDDSGAAADVDTVEDSSAVIDTVVVPDDPSTATELATADDAGKVSKTKATVSRVTKEGRSVASIHMQTSSTILTKILSEFQIGNTKKRILMSIKLQTAPDTDAASFSSNGNGADLPQVTDKADVSNLTKVNDTPKPVKTRNHTASGTQRRPKRTSNGKPTTSRTGKGPGKEAIDQSQCVNTGSTREEQPNRRTRPEWSTKQDSIGYCKGPCGREKPMK